MKERGEEEWELRIGPAVRYRTWWIDVKELSPLIIPLTFCGSALGFTLKSTMCSMIWAAAAVVVDMLIRAKMKKDREKVTQPRHQCGHFGFLFHFSSDGIFFLFVCLFVFLSFFLFYCFK